MRRRILLPISLDRVSTPISTLLRKIAEGNPGIDFYSFSSPLTDEDRECAKELWSLSHLHRTSTSRLLLQRYDVVHHASATPRNLAAVGLSKARSLGCTRHVFTANCEPYASDPYLKYYRSAVRRADDVVAVSRAVERGVRDWFRRDCDAVIPNGFDEDFYVPPVPGASRPEDVPQGSYFLWAAQILDRKHPEVFLELAARMPGQQFLMVGNDPYPGSELSRQIRSQMAELPNVNYVGRVPRTRLRNLIQHAEALVFPSGHEGLPLTVLEAIACGCPVIAQPKSSLPEVVENDVNGWMIDVTDTEAWLERMKLIVGRNRGEVATWRQRARESVLRSFSWSSIAERQGRFYERILSGGDAGRGGRRR